MRSEHIDLALLSTEMHSVDMQMIWGIIGDNTFGEQRGSLQHLELRSHSGC